jgi:hypothetical protein
MNLAIRKFASQVQGLLPLSRRRDFTMVRAHTRYPCCVIAKLTVVQAAFDLEGLLLEASIGGLLFREAATFIYDRRGEAVRVNAAGLTLAGEIVNVHARGYGIRLTEPMEEAMLEHLLLASEPRRVHDRPI